MKKHKIGFNLLPWSATMSEGLFPFMDRLKGIGYDGVECLIGSDDAAAYKALGAHAQRIQMETTAVFVLGKGENPIDPDKQVRQRALDRIKWAVDRAADMQAKVICGPFHSAHGHFSHQAPTADEYAWSAEVLHAAGAYAQQADIVFALEAVNRFETYLCNTMEQLTKLLRLVDHPSVRAMYDTHHANIEEKSIHQPIEHISPYLAHVHISENDRGTPGEGLVHWDAVFKSLAQQQYEGWYTIESFSRADPDFANAINVWREFSAPWDIAEKGYTFIQKMLLAHS